MIAGLVTAPALSWNDGDPLVLDVVGHGEERGARGNSGEREKNNGGSSFDETKDPKDFVRYLTGEREGWIASAMTLANN